MDTWNAIKHVWTDFNKEAYEYTLAMGKLKTEKPKSSQSVVNDEAKYLLCLEAGVPELDEIKPSAISVIDLLSIMASTTTEKLQNSVLSMDRPRASIIQWLSVRRVLSSA